MAEKVKIDLSVKQTEALETLEKPDVRELLYGGAKGGGKSVFLCLWAYLKAKQLIKDLKLESRKYPVPVGFLGRKRGVDFTDTTLEVWKEFIPEQNYIIRSQEKEIVIEGRAKIQYGGFDDTAAVQKFNSAKYAFAGIDQAEEVSRDDISMIRGSLGRPILGKDVASKLLLTANPKICWLKDEFISAPGDGKKFIPALPTDNPYLSTEYIERLKDAFRHRPELLQAYLYGNWDEIEGIDLVLTSADVKACVNLKLPMNDIAKIVSCDVAREGDDETVIYVFEGNKVIFTDFYSHRSTTETAGKLLALKNQYDAYLIASDVIGEGAGVVDMLREMIQDSHYQVVCPIDSREKPIDEPNSLAKFLNLRAQIWWRVADLIKDRKVCLPDDDVLIGQLSSIRYSFTSSGKIKIENKEEIKKRLGRSPDRADAIIYGLWTILKYLPTVKLSHREYIERRRRVEEPEYRNKHTGY